jgi:hypothetical protein
MNQTEGRYKVEVIADSSGKWCSNALRFDSVPAAQVYGADLAWRWTAVRRWRVFDCEGNVAVGEEVEA